MVEQRKLGAIFRVRLLFREGILAVCRQLAGKHFAARCDTKRAALPALLQRLRAIGALSGFVPAGNFVVKLRSGKRLKCWRREYAI
jgi:hypothetical protein